jgi:hypothetical protein
MMESLLCVIVDIAVAEHEELLAVDDWSCSPCNPSSPSSNCSLLRTAAVLLLAASSAPPEIDWWLTGFERELQGFTGEVVAAGFCFLRCLSSRITLALCFFLRGLAFGANPFAWNCFGRCSESQLTGGASAVAETSEALPSDKKSPGAN